MIKKDADQGPGGASSIPDPVRYPALSGAEPHRRPGIPGRSLPSVSFRDGPHPLYALFSPVRFLAPCPDRRAVFESVGPGRFPSFPGALSSICEAILPAIRKAEPGNIPPPYSDTVSHNIALPARCGGRKACGNTPGRRPPLPIFSSSANAFPFVRPVRGVFIEKTSFAFRQKRLLMAPQVGLEPTTLRLTAECSAIELLRNIENPAASYPPGRSPAKYFRR